MKSTCVGVLSIIELKNARWNIEIIKCLFNSVVGTATRYWAGRSGNRISVGARFSAPAQTASGTHAVSFTMGTGSLQGVKCPGCGVDYVTSSCAEIKERVEV